MVSAKMRKVEIQTANHRTDYRLVAFGPPAATAVAAVTGVRNYLLSRHNSSYFTTYVLILGRHHSDFNMHFAWSLIDVMQECFYYL